MARPKALFKEEVPDNLIGKIAAYLHTQCGIPGCAPVFHLEDARNIITIILDYNKKQETIKK